MRPEHRPRSTAGHLHEVVVDDRRVVLCHDALRSWRRIHASAVHLDGHTQARLSGTGHPEDARVDAQDYALVTLSQLCDRRSGNVILENE